MPRQRPTAGERFDIARLHMSGVFTLVHPDSNDPDQLCRTEFNLDSAEVRAMFRNPVQGNTQTREWWLRYMRDIGMWFADIAVILGYPSASSASAAYVRECRRVGQEPRVREANRRVNAQIAEARENRVDFVPSFLNRDHFVGEFNDFGFGIEIEQIGLGLSALNAQVRTLGYPVANDTAYGHSGYHEWKAVSDASLHGAAQTGELRSRVLRGFDGMCELRHIMLALKEAGSRVNASCGQHIHIGIEPFSQRTQGMVIRAHALLNHVFDLLLNPSRRNHDQYACHTPLNASLWNAHYFDQGEPYHATCSKYRSLNIGHYQDYGTFEFRSLHGSLNPRHTISWLQLHFDFFMLCEKIARLTTSNLMGVLQFDMANPEVVELFQTMPRTMSVIAGNRNQTLAGIGEHITALHSDETPERIANRISMLEQASAWAGDFRADALLVSPWYRDTGCGMTSQQNYRYLEMEWSQRDAAHRQRYPLPTGDNGSYTRRVEHTAGQPNAFAVWALPMLQEWIRPTSFVGNETVRKVLAEMCKKQFPMLDAQLNIPNNQ